MENKLQDQLNNLRDHFLVVRDNQSTSPSADEKEDSEVPLVSPQIKSFLETTMSEIVRNLEQKFKHNDLHKILPNSFFEKQIETVRSTFLASLNRAKDDFISRNPVNDQKIILSTKSSGRGKVKLPKTAKKVMNDWYAKNLEDPYPTHEQKMKLADQAHITLKQVNNWFINMRGRASIKSFKGIDFNDQIQKKLRTEPKK